MLSSLVLMPHTPATIVDRAELEAELESVARAGYALDRGEWAPHVRCVAVPVRDRRSRVSGALCVVGTAGMDQAPTLPLLIRRLTDTAEALSRELGYDEQLDSALP
jgi:DNA-binding IclR family transcriptional regulator